MSLADYFDNATGHGVLATAGKDGKVDAAMYARPFFMEENTALFIMAEKLTHSNLKENPWATYIFIESCPGYSGKRLYLKKIKEEQDDDLISVICRKCDYSHYEVHKRHVVYFNVEKVLPLVGSK